MKCSLGISNLKRSLVFPILFFPLYFFALITEEGFLISPWCSLELCIQVGISFLFSFAFCKWLNGSFPHQFPWNCSVELQSSWGHLWAGRTLPGTPFRSDCCWWHVCVDFNDIFYSYLFIYGCAWSLLLHPDSLYLRPVGAALPCTVRGFSLGCPLLLQSRGPRGRGFQYLWLIGLVALQYVESSQTRDRTGAPCIGRQILNHWTPRSPAGIFWFNSFSHFQKEKLSIQLVSLILCIYMWGGKSWLILVWDLHPVISPSLGKVHRNYKGHHCLVSLLTALRPDVSFFIWPRVLFFHWCSGGRCLQEVPPLYSFPGTLTGNALHSCCLKMGSFFLPLNLLTYLAALGFRCGMQDVVPQPGIKPRFPALGARSPNHWTMREVP